MKENVNENNTNETSVLFNRIYKSLPLDDFMDMTSFVVAPSGLSLIPLIQDMNYEKKQFNLSEEDVKKKFISRVIEKVTKYNLKVSIFDRGTYFYATVERKRS